MMMLCSHCNILYMLVLLIACCVFPPPPNSTYSAGKLSMHLPNNHRATSVWRAPSVLQFSTQTYSKKKMEPTCNTFHSSFFFLTIGVKKQRVPIQCCTLWEKLSFCSAVFTEKTIFDYCFIDFSGIFNFSSWHQLTTAPHVGFFSGSCSCNVWQKCIHSMA